MDMGMDRAVTAIDRPHTGYTGPRLIRPKRSSRRTGRFGTRGTARAVPRYTGIDRCLLATITGSPRGRKTGHAQLEKKRCMALRLRMHRNRTTRLEAEKGHGESWTVSSDKGMCKGVSGNLTSRQLNEKKPFAASVRREDRLLSEMPHSPQEERAQRKIAEYNNHRQAGDE